MLYEFNNFGEMKLSLKLIMNASESCKSNQNVSALEYSMHRKLGIDLPTVIKVLCLKFQIK